MRSNSRATRRPVSEVSTTRPRHSRVKSSASVRITIFVKDGSRVEGVNVMKFQLATPQVAAANISSDAEIPIHSDAPDETDGELEPLILKVGACSIAEFEKLLRELQEAK